MRIFLEVLTFSRKKYVSLDDLIIFILKSEAGATLKDLVKALEDLKNNQEEK